MYRGLYRDEEVVLKFITCTQEASFEKEFRRECRILQKIPQHEKIVKMYGVVGTCLVLEYCNLGSLFDLIHNPHFFLPLARVNLSKFKLLFEHFLLDQRSLSGHCREHGGFAFS